MTNIFKIFTYLKLRRKKCCLAVAWSRCHLHIDELCDVGGNFEVLVTIFRYRCQFWDINDIILKWKMENLSPKIKIRHYHIVLNICHQHQSRLKPGLCQKYYNFKIVSFISIREWFESRTWTQFWTAVLTTRKSHNEIMN